VILESILDIRSTLAGAFLDGDSCQIRGVAEKLQTVPIRVPRVFSKCRRRSESRSITSPVRDLGLRLA
jgi:hypothetical protein